MFKDILQKFPLALMFVCKLKGVNMRRNVSHQHITQQHTQSLILQHAEQLFQAFGASNQMEL